MGYKQDPKDTGWMNQTDDWYSEAFERTIYVYVDGERVDEKEVEVLNIDCQSETIFARECISDLGIFVFNDLMFTKLLV